MERFRPHQFESIGIECLPVSETMIRNLQMKADGIERANIVNEMPVSVKCCPTRHGCTGATNCDSCVGDYHYGR